jgi:hypothetical protein
VAKKQTKNGNGANLGFEAKLWLAADKLHNDMDAAEYKRHGSWRRPFAQTWRAWAFRRD